MGRILELKGSFFRSGQLSSLGPFLLSRSLSKKAPTVVALLSFIGSFSLISIIFLSRQPTHNNMFYTIATKKGRGLELWGTFSDLDDLYQTIMNYTFDEAKVSYPGLANRNNLISSVSYEIRKAKDGARDTANSCHYSYIDKGEYYGTKLHWVQVFFFLSALKANMSLYQVNKHDIATILLLEYWIENAIKQYDDKTFEELKPFVGDSIYGHNKLIYQYMRFLNMQFVQLGGGKKAFRQLPNILQSGVSFTEDYKSIEQQFISEAKSLGCEPHELEINDDHINYDFIKW